MRPTGEEMIAAAHLTTAVMANSTIPKDKSLEYAMRIYDDIVGVLAGMSKKESLAEIIQQVQKSDTD